LKAQDLWFYKQYLYYFDFVLNFRRQTINAIFFKYAALYINICYPNYCYNNILLITKLPYIIGTDSLMPSTICQLDKAVIVKAGEVVHLYCEFIYETSLDHAKFYIK
jgi:hypothetical protein